VQGVIIQEVWRDFDVYKTKGGTRLTGATLDSYVKDPNSSVHATETHYWELWEVDATGNVSDGGDDTFGLCSIIPWDGRGALRFLQHVYNKTKGTFVMRGRAKFYPTALTPATLGFSRTAAKSAGGLYSRTTDPSASLPVAAPGEVNYRVRVTWNSRSRGTVYSTVT
jgi:hypothetical protein